MEIELEAHVGLCPVTKKPQHFQQYLVYEVLEERRLLTGIIGWAEDSKLILLRRLDPVSRTEIISQVKAILDRELGGVVEKPDMSNVPESVFKPQQKDTIDELDEEDLTG